MGNLLQSIRSTTQIWVAMGHQYRIFALVSQMSFLWEISGDFSLKPSEQRYGFVPAIAYFIFLLK